jgi:hypothetical protein
MSPTFLIGCKDIKSFLNTQLIRHLFAELMPLEMDSSFLFGLP